MIPGVGRDDSPGALGTCYRAESKGTDTVRWTVHDWYAFNVYLSVDGQYLVRLGNWPRGQAPAAGDLAVAFYQNGVLLKKYSTLDLVKDVKAVHPSVSHYQFYQGNPIFKSYGGKGGTLTLTSIDDITYTFNIATGEIAAQMKPTAANTAFNPKATVLAVSPWSPTSNKLSGRLHFELNRTGIIMVFTELKNYGAPVKVPEFIAGNVDSHRYAWHRGAAAHVDHRFPLSSRANCRHPHRGRPLHARRRTLGGGT